MFGWEFPPFFAGGVGMVCHELTKEFAKRDDVEVTYVMPFGPKDVSDSHIRILVADKLQLSEEAMKRLKILKVPSMLGAYMTKEQYQENKKLLAKYNLFADPSGATMSRDNTAKLYGEDLIGEVYRFAEKARIIAQAEDFDVIHAHDWTTFPAAMAAKEVSGKPFVAHVHITEFDKSGGLSADPDIYRIEREGMLSADCVIAVSDFVRSNIVKEYYIGPDKIRTVHNANIEMDKIDYRKKEGITEDNQVVLYAGRMTVMKGPETFIEAARKVIDYKPNVKFIMAGSGDKLHTCINRVAELGIADKFIFHGFYTREEAQRFFGMADLFVMPSIREPFGVVPCEAMTKGTPALISKQSGCSEVLSHTLKCDFWDIDEMANKMVAVLDHKELQSTLSMEGLAEINGLTWKKPADECISIYRDLVG